MHNLFCSSCSFWKLEFFHYLKMNDTVMVKFENQNLLVFQTWNTSVKMLIFCSIFNHIVLIYFELHKTHKIPNNCAVFFKKVWQPNKDGYENFDFSLYVRDIFYFVLRKFHVTQIQNCAKFSLFRERQNQNESEIFSILKTLNIFKW